MTDNDIVERSYLRTRRHFRKGLILSGPSTRYVIIVDSRIPRRDTAVQGVQGVHRRIEEGGGNQPPFARQARALGTDTVDRENSI